MFYVSHGLAPMCLYIHVSIEADHCVVVWACTSLRAGVLTFPYSSTCCYSKEVHSHQDHKSFIVVRERTGIYVLL